MRVVDTFGWQSLNAHIGDCYCACHSPFSSCPACEHCEGNNPVARSYQERLKSRLLDIGDAVHWAKETERRVSVTNTSGVIGKTAL